MIRRMQAECKSCHGSFTLRIGVGGAKNQRLVFGCPLCGSVLHAVLIADSANLTLGFESEDLTVRATLLSRDAPTLTVYTEIPVHRDTQQARSLGEGGSAFLSLAKYMGPRLIEYQSKADCIRLFRGEVFSLMRRLCSLYATEQWSGLAKALNDSELFGDELSEKPVVYGFSRFMSSFYVPLISPDELLLWSDELFPLLNECIEGQRGAYVEYLREANGTGFKHLRRQLADVIPKCFDAADALLPGLAYSHFTPEWKQRHDEFQLFRDDLNTLKSIYVDIFEIASRSLAYLGGVINLARRKDATHWSDGKKRSLEKALELKAFAREFIVDELPGAKALFSELNRHTRNDFGHCNVWYDFARGKLMYADGGEGSFLLFLVDLLGGVRVTWYVMTLLEKLTLDQDRLGA